MKADISPEARGALKALLKKIGDDEVELLAEERELQRRILRLREQRFNALAAVDMTEADHAVCYACCAVLLPGDKVQDLAGGDMVCEECAATYAEIKQNHDEALASGMLDELDDEGIAAFAEVYAARVAAGQSVDEKPLYVYGED